MARTHERARKQVRRAHFRFVDKDAARVKREKNRNHRIQVRDTGTTGLQEPPEMSRWHRELEKARGLVPWAWAGCLYVAAVPF